MINQKALNIKIIKSFSQPILLISFWALYQQILFNLIQNSVKYNKQKGIIEISISLEKQRHSSLIEMPEYHLVTRIKDTGKGISHNRIEFLFMAFGELRKKQNRMLVEDYGLGLGLSNAKEIANHIGGDVTLASSDSKFTLFEVRTPIDIEEGQIVLN
jgi:signal transduction histidine kinase